MLSGPPRSRLQCAIYCTTYSTLQYFTITSRDPRILHVLLWRVTILSLHSAIRGSTRTSCDLHSFLARIIVFIVPIISWALAHCALVERSFAYRCPPLLIRLRCSLHSVALHFAEGLFPLAVFAPFAVFLRFPCYCPAFRRPSLM